LKVKRVLQFLVPKKPKLVGVSLAVQTLTKRLVKLSIYDVDLQQKIGQKVKRLQVDDIIVLPFVLVSGNLNWNVAFPDCTRFG
jgi:hypothetical protein